MAPCGMPWSTFGAFLVLGGTVVFALVWAAWDRSRDPDEREDDR
jgi:hypothetical protein